jgi:hypothetical protein
MACVIGVMAVAQAPVAPNETLLGGELLEVTAFDSFSEGIAPAQVLFRLKLRLTSVERVPAKASFVTAVPGDVVEIVAKQEVSRQLVGNVVRARVTFRGDDRGGRLWLLALSEE